MELKFGIKLDTQFANSLLIVPYGIEMGLLSVCVSAGSSFNRTLWN